MESMECLFLIWQLQMIKYTPPASILHYFAMIPLLFVHQNFVPKCCAVFGWSHVTWTVHPGPTPGRSNRAPGSPRKPTTATSVPFRWKRCAELGAFIGQNCQGLGLTEVGFTQRVSSIGGLFLGGSHTHRIHGNGIGIPTWMVDFLWVLWDISKYTIVPWILWDISGLNNCHLNGWLLCGTYVPTTFYMGFHETPFDRWWQLKWFGKCSPWFLGEWCNLTRQYFSNGLMNQPAFEFTFSQ